MSAMSKYQYLPMTDGHGRATGMEVGFFILLPGCRY
jgi:hypothetical protein